MKRRTSFWALRLAAASFAAGLLFTAGPGSDLDSVAYAKSDKGKTEAKAEKAKPAKSTPKVTRPTSASRIARPATRETSRSVRGSLLDRIRDRVGDARRSTRPSVTQPSRPTVRPPDLRRPTPNRPQVRPPASTERRDSPLSDVLPWRRESAPSPIVRPTPTDRPSNVPPTQGNRRPNDVIRWGGDAAPSPAVRPTPNNRESTRPNRPDPAPRFELRTGTSHNPLTRPQPGASLPRQPAVVPADQQRPMRPAPTVLRRPGRDGREVLVRPFERIDHPRVDDARRPLSRVPRRESYFRSIWTSHPPVVGRPLHLSYFTALHRSQARRYYRVYYYQCAPFYYPYDYWYAHYYVNYYYPCYYGRPYVVIAFPIFIERYHRVDCCPRYEDGVWYYYDRQYDGYDRQYPYLTNYPGTLGRALRDLQWAWYEEEIGYLVPHVDEREELRIYRGDDHTHDLAPSEFLDLTLDAFDQTETDYIKYTEIQRIRGGGWARANAKHVFWDGDGEVRTVYLSYLLERVSSRDGDKWTLREVRQDSRPF